MQATAGPPVHDHMVPGIHGFHTRSDLHDGSGTLVAEKMRQEFVGTLCSIDFIDLCTTYSAVMNFYEYLAEGKILRGIYFTDN